ncbi:hypothetical protein HDV06_002162 [Boothiomyces sp. JEL0866]|nr:hypothetical protein HDV06_002162 [Boothiomyces sp. JEL0866]
MQELNYLWESAHKMLSHSPEISRHLILQFINLSIQNNIPISTTVSRSYCQKCGSIYIPGLNTVVSIQKRPKSKQFFGPSAVLPKKNDKISWYTCYKCLCCTTETVFPVCNQSQLKKTAGASLDISVDLNTLADRNNSTVTGKSPGKSGIGNTSIGIKNTEKNT